MSASWHGFARAGWAARTSSYDEGLALGPLSTVSPNVPLLSSKFSPPPTRPPGMAALSLPTFRPMADQATPLIGGFLESSNCFSAFGELADESKIGELPTDDDLMLRLFDPPPHSSGGFLVEASPHAAFLDASNFWPDHPASMPQIDSAFGAGGAGGPGAGTAPSHVDTKQAAAVPVAYAQLAGPTHDLTRQPSVGGSKRRGDHNEQHEVLSMPKRAARRTETEDADSPRSTLHRQRSAPSSHPAAEPSHHAAVRGGSNPRASKGTAATVAAAGSGNAAPPAQVFRGVSRHRLTQRWEASLWLAGRQLYLGGFDSQKDAARAYDLAALACKGPGAVINFPAVEYAQQLSEIHGFSREEVVAYVRRRSAAFSRGKSRHRGVSGHNGRWEARIGAFGGKKNVSFGVFETEEGAARQYDRALILEKGRSAKTNFPLRQYEAEVAEYEAYLIEMCGSVQGPAAARLALEYTLPRDRVATADEKKRSAIIYGEALWRALRTPSA